MRSIFLVVVLLSCAYACDRSAAAIPANKGPSPDEIQARLLRISETALAAKKPADKPALPWETLATMLPDTVGKLTATGPATGHVDTTDTLIAKAKRSYSADGHAVKIELMDVTRAPSVLHAFMLQRGAVQRPMGPPSDARNNDGTVTEATTVGAYPALTRFTQGTQESIVTLVLAQRLVIEIQMTPSTTTADVTRIAIALPLSGMEALVTTP